MIFCNKCNCLVMQPLKGEITCSICLGLSNREIAARIVDGIGQGDWAKNHMIANYGKKICNCSLCAGLATHVALTKADPKAHKYNLPWAKDME